MEKALGITIAGNVLVDIVKNVEKYPQKGMLEPITSMSMAVGGCVPNTGITLAKVDNTIPITALGKIGNDDNGRFVMSKMKEVGIDCEKIKISPQTPTSVGDIINASDGERTMFHYRGANAEFSPEDIEISSLNSELLHIGYVFLLDKFDEEDAEYGTVMARFLHNVQKAGIKTSIDTISDINEKYKAKIIPALKYCDYAILNEIESGLISGLDSYNADETLNVENIKLTMKKMAEYGVKEKIVVHCKSAGFCLDVKTDTFTMVPSVKIPKEVIKGSVGAGDSFCAGCLYSIYNKLSDEEMLKFASLVAASNLFSENSVDGILPKEKLSALEEKYGRLEL